MLMLTVLRLERRVNVLLDLVCSILLVSQIFLRFFILFMTKLTIGLSIQKGQCLSILAAFLFPSAEGPKYIKGMFPFPRLPFSAHHLTPSQKLPGASVNVAFQCLGLVIALCMSYWFRRENKRRDIVEGGRPAPGTVLNVIEEFDLAPGEFSIYVSSSGRVERTG